MSLTLRPYQQLAVHDLRLAIRAGARAPLLVAPTGMGKTVIMADILRSIASRGRTAMVLVHRRELIAQTSAKLTMADVPHGIIAAGVASADAPIQVASVQTLARRLQHVAAQPDLIVIDEAHHAIAGTWGRTLSHWPDALRLGVTATPLRRDGRGLREVFDHLVLGPSTADLIADGFLCPARIYAPPAIADLSNLRRRAGDFASDQAADAMDRPTVTGDAIAHYRKLASGQRAIAFCCNVNHAAHVCTAFNQAGIRADTLLGSTDPVRRDAAVARFSSGDLQVLVTVDVVSEGFDIPAAGCAILLRPTQSLGLYLQQVGRVLRPAPGKDAAIVLDHVGNVHRHGFPDDPREWSLDGVQRRAGAGGPAAPSVRTCEQCFAAFKPAPICPACGAQCAPIRNVMIRQVDGELRELKRTAKLMEFEERHAQRSEVARARTLPQLLAVAKQRGYSPGWAYRIHSARQQRRRA